LIDKILSIILTLKFFDRLLQLIDTSLWAGCRSIVTGSQEEVPVAEC